MKRAIRIAAALAATLAAASAQSDGPELRGGGMYALRVEPDDDRLGDPGWGIGSEVAWYLPGLPRFLVVEVGLDAGDLDTDDPAPAGGSSGTTAILATGHGYYRIFGGMSAGVPERSPVQPHAGIHLGLARQEVQLLQFDPLFGEFQQLETESASGLAYDATAGIVVRLTRQLHLDAGVRYLWAPEVSIGSGDGRRSVGAEFALYYLGVTFRGD